MLKDDIEKELKGKIPDEQYRAAYQLAVKLDKKLELTKILNDDASKAILEMKNETNTAYNSRTAIRTFFAAVEGNLFSMGQAVVDICVYKGIELTKEELDKLDEKKLVSLKERFKFTIEVFMKRILGRQFSVDTGKEWDNFCRAIKIRDGLMHPKTTSDLEISDKDKLRFLKGSYWALQTIALPFQSINENAVSIFK